MPIVTLMASLIEVPRPNGRGYPQDMIEDYAKDDKSSTTRLIAGDLERIAVDSDFLGINYYSRVVIARKIFQKKKIFHRQSSQTVLAQTLIGKA